MLEKALTKRKITLQKIKFVCVADIFLCHIYFELSLNFTNNPGPSTLASMVNGDLE